MGPERIKELRELDAKFDRCEDTPALVAAAINALPECLDEIERLRKALESALSYIKTVPLSGPEIAKIQDALR